MNVVHYWDRSKGSWREARLVSKWLGGAESLDHLKAEIQLSGRLAQKGRAGSPPNFIPSASQLERVMSAEELNKARAVFLK